MKIKFVYFLLLISFIYLAFSINIKDVGNAENTVITTMDLEQISKALAIYKDFKGDYPNSELGLEILMLNQSELNGQKIIKKIPSDIFGEKYVYHYPSICGLNTYDLYSKGMNKMDECGQGDDLFIPD